MRWLQKTKPNRTQRSRKAVPRLRALIDVFEPRILLSDTYSLSNLASFDSTTGDEANAALVVDSHGNFFGTTSDGGTNGLGTVYERAAGSGTITTIASFTVDTGYDTQAGLTLDASGDLFGITPRGGLHANGTVFEIPAGSSTITVVANLSPANTESSGTLALDSSGNLYGTTYSGGNNNDGTIFKIASGTSTAITLASFNSTTGDMPTSGVILDSNGNLYGTTTAGGINNSGTIFELPAGSSSITTLAALPAGSGVDQTAPLVIDSHGNLFGTTIQGGINNDGSVYELPAGDHAVVTLASMDWITGTNPSAGLILDSNGDLFGTTTNAGVNGLGTVFELTAGSGAVTPLIAFDGIDDAAGDNALGSYPVVMPSLVTDIWGDLFGVAGNGGSNGLGALYEVSRVHATHNVITTQPTSVTAGTVQTVAVSLEKDDSTVDTYLSFPVTLSIASGPADASLGGTLTVSAASGVATFSDLTFTKAGTYTLTASATGLAAGTSTTITVTAAAAAQLVVAQQPTNTIAGQTISAVVVDVEDAFGNLVTTDASTLTISCSDNTPFSGTANVVASGGMATFSDLSITRVGKYTLSAIDGSLTPTTTNLFSIIPAAAVQLVVVDQPTNTLAGQAIGPVTVEIEDTFGNLVTGDSSAVNISTVDGTPLRGTVSANAVSGVATFANLSIVLVGTYTLSAIDTGFTAVKTDSFTISSAAAAKLVIDQQPINAAAGLTMGQVVVDVEDAFGNLVVSDQSNVTISTNALLTGTTTVSAHNGVAVFNNLAIATPGIDTLAATDAALTTANSAPITVIPTVVAGKKLASTVITPSTAFASSTVPSKWLIVQVENQAGLIVMTRKIPVKHDRATFKNLMLKQAGDYTLVISNAQEKMMTQAFVVIPAAPAKMAFVTPSTTVDRTAALCVRVTDKYGNLTTARDGATVTLRLAAGKHMILSGTVSATVINGTATFTDVSVNHTGRAQLIAVATKLHLAKTELFENASKSVNH